MGKNALEFSLNFEAEGTRTYLKLAQKSKHPLGKRLLYSLAAQEVGHAKKIDEFCMSKVNPQSMSNLFDRELPDMESNIKEFFLEMRQKKIAAQSDDVSVYEAALELEKKGYKIYEQFIKEAETESEREFFKFLLGEEKEHIDSIVNVYSYLTNTGDWLENEESKTWNWMNL